MIINAQRKGGKTQTWPTRIAKIYKHPFSLLLTYDIQRCLSLTVSLGLYCTLTYRHRSSTRSYKQRLLDHIPTVPQIMQNFLSPSQIVAGKNGVPLKTVLMRTFASSPPPSPPSLSPPSSVKTTCTFLLSVQSQNLLRASKGCTSRKRKRGRGRDLHILKEWGSEKKGRQGERRGAERANTQKREGREGEKSLFQFYLPPLQCRITLTVHSPTIGYFARILYTHNF